MRAFLAFGLAACASPLAAQCLLCGGGSAAPAVPLRPLSVQVETTLDFSRAAHIGAQVGSIELDERTGSRRVKGLQDLGGVPLLGRVRVTGQPLARVRIGLPATVMLTSADGSVAEVTGLKADVIGGAQLDLRGELAFAFGGRLKVTGRDAGNFSGRLAVTVDYE